MLSGRPQEPGRAAAMVTGRLGLERQLLELQGNTAALRALDLAQLDESNRALQEQIWALQDQQKAADEAAAAAEKLRSARTQITDGLLAEVARIRGSMDGGAKTYAQALSEFNAATLAVRRGDQEAAKSLPGLSQTSLLVLIHIRRRRRIERGRARLARLHRPLPVSELCRLHSRTI